MGCPKLHIGLDHSREAAHHDERLGDFTIIGLPVGVSRDEQTPQERQRFGVVEDKQRLKYTGAEEAPQMRVAADIVEQCDEFAGGTFGRIETSRLSGGTQESVMGVRHEEVFEQGPLSRGMSLRERKKREISSREWSGFVFENRAQSGNSVALRDKGRGCGVLQPFEFRRPERLDSESGVGGSAGQLGESSQQPQEQAVHLVERGFAVVVILAPRPMKCLPTQIAQLRRLPRMLEGLRRRGVQ